jgi:hypothetical protein
MVERITTIITHFSMLTQPKPRGWETIPTKKIHKSTKQAKIRSLKRFQKKYKKNNSGCAEPFGLLYSKIK